MVLHVPKVKDNYGNLLLTQAIQVAFYTNALHVKAVPVN